MCYEFVMMQYTATTTQLISYFKFFNHKYMTKIKSFFLNCSFICWIRSALDIDVFCHTNLIQIQFADAVVILLNN